MLKVEVCCWYFKVFLDKWESHTSGDTMTTAKECKKKKTTTKQTELWRTVLSISVTLCQSREQNSNSHSNSHRFNLELRVFVSLDQRSRNEQAWRVLFGGLKMMDFRWNCIRLTNMFSIETLVFDFRPFLLFLEPIKIQPVKVEFSRVARFLKPTQ